MLYHDDILEYGHQVLEVVARLIRPPVRDDLHRILAECEHSLDERRLQFFVVLRIHKFMIQWKREINAQHLDIGR